jgi:hypothetical protein
VILINDPLKPADALSEARRQSINEWDDTTLYSRLNDKTKGTIIIRRTQISQFEDESESCKASNQPNLLSASFLFMRRPTTSMFKGI